MALRGQSSQSFLRSKDLISFSEISYDKEGNNVSAYKILEEALARDGQGNFIRNKANIAKILNKYGILYRMIFNAMNMEQYTYNEIEESLKHLSAYINDLGVSGIVEFHASDKTQNSDHIHFWISSEDRVIYNKIALEMVAMGYSNEEDIYIQKYEENYRLDESEYVQDEDTLIEERFSIQPMGMEAGETLHSINEMLTIGNEKGLKENPIVQKTASKKSLFSSLHQKYTLLVDNITNLFQKTEEKLTIVQETKSSFFEKRSSIVENCTLEKTEEINSILSRIKELKNN